MESAFIDIVNVGLTFYFLFFSSLCLHVSCLHLKICCAEWAIGTASHCHDFGLTPDRFLVLTFPRRPTLRRMVQSMQAQRRQRCDQPWKALAPLSARLLWKVAAQARWITRMGWEVRWRVTVVAGRWPP